MRSNNVHYDTYDRYDTNGGGAGRVFAGVLIGGLIGAAVGFLMAPVSGQELRRTIREELEGAEERARSLMGEAEAKGREMQDRGREVGPQDVTERLRSGRPQVARGLDDVRRQAAETSDDVVVDDHDAEGHVPDDDRPEPEADLTEREGRSQRDPGHDPRERDGEHHDERDRVLPEEARAVDGAREKAPEHDRHAGGERSHREGQPQSGPHVLIGERHAEPDERQRR